MRQDGSVIRDGDDEVPLVEPVRLLRAEQPTREQIAVREVSDRTVELFRQMDPAPAVPHEERAVLPSRDERVPVPDDGQPTVRRPGRSHRAARERRERAEPPSVGRDEERLRHLAVDRPVGRGRQHRDRRPARRPDRARGVAGGRRDPSRLPSGRCGRDPHRGQLVDDPGAVEPPERRRDPAHGRIRRDALDESLLAVRGDHGDPPTVGRPLRRGDPVGEAGKHRRLAAPERHHPDLRLLSFAIRHEQHPAAVRRDPRTSVRRVRIREPFGTATVNGDPPQPRPVPIAFDRLPCVHHRRVVGREIEARDPDLRADVRAAERTGGVGHRSSSFGTVRANATPFAGSV